MECSYRAQVEQRFSDRIATGEGVEGSPFISRILSRKTVRKIRQRRSVGCAARSGHRRGAQRSAKSDLQQASVLRVADPKRREAIGALFPAMPWSAKAPVFFICLGDARRLERIAGSRGKAIANGTLEGFFHATVDAAGVMQTFILAAGSVGLRCRPISVIRNRIDQVASICALPDEVFPVAGLCVGYPVDGGPVSMRLPRTVTVHCDEYRDDPRSNGLTNTIAPATSNGRRIVLATPISTAGPRTRRVKRQVPRARHSRSISGRMGSRSTDRHVPCTHHHGACS